MNTLIGQRRELDEIINQIRTYVPLIEPYYSDSRTVLDYSRHLRKAPVSVVHRERQRLLLDVVRRVVDETYGGDLSRDIGSREIGSLNIVDHHQLFNNPLLLGTNIIPNADRILNGAVPGDDRKVIVTVSCANIAPGNDYLRGGFRFRGRQVRYFSAREYKDVIYFMPQRRFDFVERLKSRSLLDEFDSEDQHFLHEYQDILNGLPLRQSDGHKEQIASAIRCTWPMLFGRDVRARVPELAYITGEDLATCALSTLLKEDNFLSRVIFDAGFRSTALEQLRGVVVAWNEPEGKGTHFFWGVRPCGKRLTRMYVQDGYLVPHDPRFASRRIRLCRSEILAAMEKREIIPAVSLINSVLLYFGVQLLVGPGSLVYTTHLRNGWVELLRKFDCSAEAELMSRLDTGALVAGAPLFFGGMGPQGNEPKVQYATDIMAAGGIDANTLRGIFSRPLREVLSVGVGGIYSLFSSYIPANLHIRELISFEDAARVVYGGS